jgi:hypothetical protein
MVAYVDDKVFGLQVKSYEVICTKVFCAKVERKKARKVITEARLVAGADGNAHRDIW